MKTVDHDKHTPTIHEFVYHVQGLISNWKKGRPRVVINSKHIPVKRTGFLSWLFSPKYEEGKIVTEKSAPKVKVNPSQWGINVRKPHEQSRDYICTVLSLETRPRCPTVISVLFPSGTLTRNKRIFTPHNRLDVWSFNIFPQYRKLTSGRESYLQNDDCSSWSAQDDESLNNVNY